MNRVLHRCISASLQRLNGRKVSAFRPVVLFCAIFLSSVVQAQFASPDGTTARSVSGQFVVNASPQFSPLLHRSDLATNTNLVRLEPSLLAVSAERFKISLWRQLGLKPGANWSGKIFLTLHPARTPNDEVTINIGPVLKTWNYRVDLPDVVTRTRYARALAAVLLLEIANRGNPDPNHSAEIPPWLAVGFAQSALASDDTKVILSAPAGTMNGLSQSRLDKNE